MSFTVPQTHERVVLKGRQPVSRTTIHGWPSVILGLPFAGMGTFILLMGLEKIEVDPSKVHAPMWVIAVCGLLFVLAGYGNRRRGCRLSLPVPRNGRGVGSGSRSIPIRRANPTPVKAYRTAPPPCP